MPAAKQAYFSMNNESYKNIKINMETMEKYASLVRIQKSNSPNDPFF
jgi:hypothetical protein